MRVLESGAMSIVDKGTFGVLFDTDKHGRIYILSEYFAYDAMM